MLQRRVCTSGLVAAGLVLSFAAGTLAATSRPKAAAPTHSALLDDAAAQISAQALRPVTAQALDAAAIAAMLHAAGDPWGSWSAGARGVSGLSPDSTGAWDAHLVGPRAAGRGSRPQPPRFSAVLESTGPAVIGRLTVPAFVRGTGRTVAAAMARLRAAHAAGVILDLRGNPGGLLVEAVQTASAFLDGGPVVSYRRRDSAPVQLVADPGGDTRTPLVVLVDGGTASAAEVVAGALQDRDRAVLVGSRTFGKGTVQEPRSLADGSALELTVASYATPAGHSVDGLGLAPDIEVAPGSAPGVAAGRAREVLAGLVADRTSTAGGRG